MFRSPLRIKLGSWLKSSSFVVHCEEDVPQQTPETKNKRVATPSSYDSLKNTFGQATVPAYDGFRVIVQKQVNLNTVASHFYWIGSQVTGQPIYQYRIILPFDEAVVNVASDIAMNNVEGEVRIPHNSNMASKVSFNLGDQNQVTGDLELTDDSSNMLLQLSKGAESSVSMSYMQALTPNITLGGIGTYSLKTSSISTGFAAVLTRDDHSVAAQWDNNWRLLYLRKVNPNRVHLMTDLTIDEAGNSLMSCSAEYFLKQSKLHFGVDSNFQIKSLLETSLNKDMQLQLSADVNQIKSSYRFGFGLVISG